MIYSFEPFGYEGSLVDVEADIRDGIPAVDIVGIADSAVRESRERTRSAIKNSGFEFPQKRVLLSLSPADLRKNSAIHDLSIALAVLCSAYKKYPIEKTIALGEVSLDGSLRPCNGTYAAMQTALKNGITRAVLPESADNPPKGMKAVYANNLKEAFYLLADFDTVSEDTKTSGNSAGSVEFPELDDGENPDDIFLPDCD
uniref:magnesium chelatase domain-containing protein n=1 Tax=uncultured Treponema sp. TaxID=162155 RepID=UPI00280B84DF